MAQHFQDDLKKIHHFPPLSNSERLEYKLLTEENSYYLVELFQQDNSKFVDKRFKNEEEARKYAQESEAAKYYVKHGGCDFLIRLKNTETYIGVLHLFDLSTETFADNHLRANIGFAIAAPFREQYYATEAVKNLINYIQNTLQKNNILAYTHPNNDAANYFLLSLGMSLNNDDYIFGYNYYELQ